MGTMNESQYGNDFVTLTDDEGNEIVETIECTVTVKEIQKKVAPVIDDESWSEVPTERWMTMTTCHPEYGNWQRYIVHLKFESWTPKDTGVPAELVDEPTN